MDYVGIILEDKESHFFLFLWWMISFMKFWNATCKLIY